ncbi:MAG: PQQ-like beta-propeller repeat protein [Gemmataceae bacterium]|nr:PQQ-like beta-propeller repeat protein [Gemmataceae bacterium]
MRPVGLVFFVLVFSGVAAADDWPQWMGPNRDGIWREDGVIDSLPAAPKFKWKIPLGAGYAGPAVFSGKVYVTDRILAPETKNPANSFAANIAVPGQERVHRIDARTGKTEWTHAYDCPYKISFASGPRCTPVVADGVVYTLGAMGHLISLEAESGKVRWQHDLMKEYAAPAQVWGFSAHPLLENDRLICLVGGDATVVAFHKDSGKELWRALSVRNVGYCPPVIYSVAGRRVLVIWHPEAVCGLNPENGEVLWEQPFKLHQSALSIPMPRMDGDRLFITSFYNGPLMLRLGTNPREVTVVWKGNSNSEQPNRTDKLHSIMPTPVLRDGHIYGVCSYGQLRCLKIDDGSRVWESMRATRPMKKGTSADSDSKPTQEDRWGNAFITPQGGRDWLFNEHGELILAKLSPAGYEEVGRMKLLEADNLMARHPVVWSHPAYSERCCFVRNDSQLACVDLSK